MESATAKGYIRAELKLDYPARARTGRQHTLNAGLPNYQLSAEGGLDRKLQKEIAFRAKAQEEPQLDLF